MLVWDYDLKKVKFDDCNKIKSNIAKKMSMKADMKSNSYKAEGKKAGYSFYQTVRLSVDVIFDRADELKCKKEFMLLSKNHKPTIKKLLMRILAI